MQEGVKGKSWITFLIEFNHVDYSKIGTKALYNIISINFSDTSVKVSKYNLNFIVIMKNATESIVIELENHERREGIWTLICNQKNQNVK
jgi:hypothetical protein